MKAHARGEGGEGKGEEKGEGDGKFKMGSLVIPHWCFEVVYGVSFNGVRSALSRSALC